MKKNLRKIKLAAQKAYRKDPTNLRLLVRYYAARYNCLPTDYYAGALDAVRTFEECINLKGRQQ